MEQHFEVLGSLRERCIDWNNTVWQPHHRMVWATLKKEFPNIISFFQDWHIDGERAVSGVVLEGEVPPYMYLHKSKKYCVPKASTKKGKEIQTLFETLTYPELMGHLLEELFGKDRSVWHGLHLTRPQFFSEDDNWYLCWEAEHTGHLIGHPELRPLLPVEVQKLLKERV